MTLDTDHASCPGEDLKAFVARKDRVWLNLLLEPQGPFIDVFRRYHPDR